jgi:hypothetical protein
MHLASVQIGTRGAEMSVPLPPARQEHVSVRVYVYTSRFGAPSAEPAPHMWAQPAASMGGMRLQFQLASDALGSGGFVDDHAGG